MELEEKHRQCLLCGDDVDSRKWDSAVVEAAKLVDDKNKTFLNVWNEQCILGVCRLLGVSSAHPVHQLLFADTTSYCETCEQIMRDVHFTLSTMDKMQERIIAWREQLAKNVDENWINLGKTGQRRKMFGVEVKKLYNHVKQECYTWTRVDFLKVNDIEIEAESKCANSPAKELPMWNHDAGMFGGPVEIKLEPGDKFNENSDAEAADAYCPDEPEFQTPFSFNTVENEPSSLSSKELEYSNEVEDIYSNISTSSYQQAIPAAQENCEELKKSLRRYRGKKYRNYKNLLKYVEAKKAARALEKAPAPAPPKHLRKKVKPMIIRPSKPKPPPTSKRCSFCNLSIALAEIEAHENLHKSRQFPYSCLQCDENFALPAHLAKHVVKMHTPETMHTCTQCGKTVNSKYDLNIHSRLHDPLFTKYTCKLCGKKFARKRTYEIHMTAHDKTKKFICELCGKAYSRLDKLNNHKTIHDDKPKFKCQVCGKAFKSFGGLRMHLPIHAGMTYQCPACPKTFTTEAYLKQHSRCHLPKEQRKYYYKTPNRNNVVVVTPPLNAPVESSSTDTEIHLNQLNSTEGSREGSSSSLPEHLPAVTGGINLNLTSSDM